jgi:hypothetical protein
LECRSSRGHWNRSTDKYTGHCPFEKQLGGKIAEAIATVLDIRNRGIENRTAKRKRFTGLDETDRAETILLKCVLYRTKRIWTSTMEKSMNWQKQWLIYWVKL